MTVCVSGLQPAGCGRLRPSAPGPALSKQRSSHVHFILERADTVLIRGREVECFRVSLFLLLIESSLSRRQRGNRYGPDTDPSIAVSERWLLLTAKTVGSQTGQLRTS